MYEFTIMLGAILDYSPKYKIGIVIGEDQKRYQFSDGVWESDLLPLSEQQVKFEIDQFGVVVTINIIHDHKNKVIATDEKNRNLLSALKGVFVVDKFDRS